MRLSFRLHDPHAKFAGRLTFLAILISAPALSFAQSTLVDFEDVDTSSNYPPVGELYVDQGLFMEMGEAANNDFPPGPWNVGPWAEDVSVGTIINKAMCPARAASYHDCGWGMYLRFIEPGNPQSSALATGASVDVLFMHQPGSVRVSWLNENGNVVASQTNQNFIGYDANCTPQCDLPGCADGHQTFTAPVPVSGIWISPTGAPASCQGGETYWIDNITFELIDQPDHDPKNDKDLGCNANSVGNPCDAGTGNKHQRETDYASPTMSFSRFYNSGLKMDVGLGFGWTSTFHKRLEQYADGTIRARRADGRSEPFHRSNNLWRAEADSTSTLVESATDYTLTLADKSVETYDLSGRVLSETDRNGRSLTFHYSVSTGHLERVTDSFGMSLFFSYGAGRLQTLTDSAGRSTTYTYDAAGNLTSATDSNYAVRLYHYEDARFPHHLTGITDENSNRFATWSYDATGKAASSEHAGGADRITLTYSFPPILTTVTDALGISRVYSFVPRLDRIKNTGISQPCADCDLAAARSYDTRGSVTSKIDFEGNRTCYAYDSQRMLETVRVEGLGSAVTACPADLAGYSPAAGTRERKITTTWHASFPFPTSIMQADRTTGYSYDAKGNVLTRTVTDTTSHQGGMRSWTYTYNDYGQVLTENGPRTDVNDLTTYTYYLCNTGAQCGQVHTISNALGQVTTYDTYNVHGQPLAITDPNGVVTTLTYDERLRLTSRTVGSETHLFDYWPTGLLKKVTLPDSSHLLYTYDNAHRLIRVEDTVGNRIEYTLDAMGNRTAQSTYDPSNLLSRTRTRVFNSLNQLWKEIGAAGTATVTTVFGYDDNGNQTGIDAPLNRNTVNAYDELNRLKQITDPGSGITRFGFDANDNLTSVTDPRSLVTSYAYTGFGDLKTTTSPDTGTTTHTHDSAGNLETSTDARKAITTYTYDALDRVMSVAFKIGKVTDQTITFTYDAGTHGKGHLTGASDADHSLVWAYDAQGRVIGKNQSVGAVIKSVGYAYDAGRLVTMTMPSGQLVTYGYNSNNQIVSLTVGSTTVLSGAIYEPFGPVRGWTWGNSAIMARSFDTDGNLSQFDSGGFKTYSYDDAFRITGITDVETSANSFTYGYDALDRITSASKPGTTFGWTYDANGNRLSQSGSGASTYTISPSSNRISSISGGLARTYTYNAAGNTTGYTTATVGYNNRGRMKTLTKAGITATYVYDALGRRIKQSGGTPGTVLYMYDETGHLIGEYDNAGALIQETIWFNDIPVATLRPNGSGGVTVFYVHTDHLNTPRKITRPSDNAITWRWDSDPFGTSVANEDPDGDTQSFVYNLRFPGQYYDPETGLHYNYFRDYDPQTGRYVQSDPIGLDGGLNTYGYVNASPVMSTDPRGLWTTGSSRSLPDENTIICDGRGGIEIQLAPLDPLLKECIGECIQAHEQVHRSDALRAVPGICAGKPRGLLVQATTRDEQNENEIPATKAELECLERKLNGLPSNQCHMCDGPLRDRITQMRRYLTRASRYEL